MADNERAVSVEPDQKVAVVEGSSLARKLSVLGASAVAALTLMAGCDKASGAPDRAQTTTTTTPNTTAEPELDLTKSTVPELRKLDMYERLFGRHVVDEVMIFSDTPTTLEAAEAQAASMAKTLADFKERGRQPLIVFEPQANGQALDFRKYLDDDDDYDKSEYGKSLNAYFAALKAECAKLGVTDVDIAQSTWVFGPELNTPVWSENGDHTSVDPAVFAAMVTRTARALKHEFLAAKASVLLDSMTYRGNSWDAEAEYDSLVPYLTGIPRGLLDSVGIQGLPWLPAQGESGPEKIYPEDYFAVKQGVEAAMAAGVPEVWLNTGTFGLKYTNTDRPLMVNNTLRARMLNGVLDQARAMQREGLQVSVNVFAGDKSRTKEATDWSYLADPGQQRVLGDFLKGCKQASVGVSLFDA